MRRLPLIALLGLASCREAPHIDISFALACDTSAGAPVAPATCDQMALGCSNFVELRLYEARGAAPGNLLGSNCVAASDLGDPTDLCSLKNLAPVTLLNDLPDGQTVIFRMRSLHVYDMEAACNDDLAREKPVTLFDGFSPPVAIDGNDHQVQIGISSCGSCDNLAAVTDMPQCLTPGSVTPAFSSTQYQGGAVCCPSSLTCKYQPGATCPSGGHALLLPGACCGSCPTAAPASGGAGGAT